MNIATINTLGAWRVVFQGPHLYATHPALLAQGQATLMQSSIATSARAVFTLHCTEGHLGPSLLVVVPCVYSTLLTWSGESGRLLARGENPGWHPSASLFLPSECADPLDSASLLAEADSIARMAMESMASGNLAALPPPLPQLLWDAYRQQILRAIN